MKKGKTRPEERSKIVKSPVDKDEINIVCSMARPMWGNTCRKHVDQDNLTAKADKWNKEDMARYVK